MGSRRNIKFTATERANDAPVLHCTDVSPRNLKQAAAETNLHLKSPLREVTLHLEASNSFLPDVVSTNYYSSEIAYVADVYLASERL